MSSKQSERKFWGTPELLESLLPFLDPESVLNLVKCHDLTLNILQGSHNWKKLVKRSCPDDPGNEYQDEMETNIKIVRNLAGILKLMKNQEKLLMTFLHMIWAKLYPGNVRAVDDYDQNSLVLLDCPHPELNLDACGNGHHIRFSGFVLLEEVERIFNTALQNVERVWTWDLKEPSLSALGSRIARQKKTVAPFKVWSVKIQTEKSALALKTLMRVCPDFTEYLYVVAEIGTVGWEILAEAMQLQPGVVNNLDTPKILLGEATQESLRAIWDAMGMGGEWVVGDPSHSRQYMGHCLQKETGEDDWKRLTEYIEMSDEEFLATLGEMRVETEEDEEDDDERDLEDEEDSLEDEEDRSEDEEEDEENKEEESENEAAG